MNVLAHQITFIIVKCMSVIHHLYLIFEIFLFERVNKFEILVTITKLIHHLSKSINFFLHDLGKEKVNRRVLTVSFPSKVYVVLEKSR
jgi:hypothetical protein